MGLTFAFIMTSGETLMFIEPYPNPDSPLGVKRVVPLPTRLSSRVASVGSGIPHLIFEYLRQLSETPPPGWPGSYPGYPSRNGVLAKMAVSYQPAVRADVPSVARHLHQVALREHFLRRPRDSRS